MFARLFFIKWCVVWCILSVPKYVIINLKSTIFQFLRIIKQQQPKFGAIFFSKINLDAHVSTKTNTFPFYGGGGGGVGHQKIKKF